MSELYKKVYATERNLSNKIFLVNEACLSLQKATKMISRILVLTTSTLISREVRDIL